MTDDNPLEFVNATELAPLPPRAKRAAAVEGPALDLDKLPQGVVSGNTLIDFSGTASPAIRSGVSMAMMFAGRAADDARKPGDDEDDWFAAYMSNLRRLGFVLSQTAVTTNRFKKRGVTVHEAIIPFLTVALGGAAVGPVILAALKNLGDMDEDRPWITLFDRESRKFTAREIHFAAVSADSMQTSLRHVSARLSVENTETNVLFFRITNASAEFESATTTMSANNSLLPVLEPALRDKMKDAALDFIASVAL